MQFAYLLMKDFDEQVLQFLQVQLPGAMVAWHEHQPDMLQVVHSAKDISFSIVLHYLKESRDTHFVKMAMIPRSSNRQTGATMGRSVELSQRKGAFQVAFSPWAQCTSACQGDKSQVYEQH
jgi:hypothetical protein